MLTAAARGVLSSLPRMSSPSATFGAASGLLEDVILDEIARRCANSFALHLANFEPMPTSHLPSAAHPLSDQGQACRVALMNSAKVNPFASLWATSALHPTTAMLATTPFSPSDLDLPKAAAHSPPVSVAHPFASSQTLSTPQPRAPLSAATTF